MSGAAAKLQFDVDNSLEETRQHEAAWLARQREADPDFDPWRPVPAEATRQAEVREAAPIPPLVVEPEAELPEPELREALRNAHAEREARWAEVETAQAVLERAATAMAEADAAMQSYADLDEQLVAFRVAKIKEGTPRASLPYALECAMRDGSRGVDAADGSHKAHARLAEELKQAEAALQRAQGAVHQAALPLLGHHARQLAGQLQEAEATAYSLRQSLASFAVVQLAPPGLTPEPASLPSTVKRLLNEPAKPAEADADTKEQWREYYHELLADPEATPPCRS